MEKQFGAKPQWTFVFGQKSASSWLELAFVSAWYLYFVFALVIIGILERQGFGWALGSESFLVFLRLFHFGFCANFCFPQFNILFVRPTVCHCLLFLFFALISFFLGGPEVVSGVKLAILCQMDMQVGRGHGNLHCIM